MALNFPATPAVNDIYTSGAQNASAAHNNIHPYITLNYVIKT